MTTLLQDLRFAIRLFRRNSPGFAITAVLTLTLAISANAVVFAIWNALIQRPVNVPQAESLFLIQHGNDGGSHSIPTIAIFASAIAASTHVAVFAITQSGLDTGKDPSNVWQDANERKLLRRIAHSALHRPFLPRFR